MMGYHNRDVIHPPPHSFWQETDMDAFTKMDALIRRVHTFMRENPHIRITAEMVVNQFNLCPATARKFMKLREDYPSLDNGRTPFQVIRELELDELNANEVRYVADMLRYVAVRRTAARVGMTTPIFKRSMFGLGFFLDEIHPEGCSIPTLGRTKYPLKVRLEWLRRMDAGEVTRADLAQEIGVAKSTMGELIQDSEELKRQHDFYKRRGLTTWNAWHTKNLGMATAA